VRINKYAPIQEIGTISAPLALRNTKMTVSLRVELLMGFNQIVKFVVTEVVHDVTDNKYYTVLLTTTHNTYLQQLINYITYNVM